MLHMFVHMTHPFGRPAYSSQVLRGVCQVPVPEFAPSVVSSPYVKSIELGSSVLCSHERGFNDGHTDNVDSALAKAFTRVM